MTNKIFFNNILLCLEYDPKYEDDVKFIKENFCGKVINSLADIHKYDARITYIMSDVDTIKSSGEVDIFDENVFFINFEKSITRYDINMIFTDNIPLNIHNVGVLFRKCTKIKYFEKIVKAHEFQLLTESNKPGVSYRKGIYLSPVSKYGEFNLLRCSTNLNGPTEKFSHIDKEIVLNCNTLCDYFFEQPVTLNHVLAQIYENQLVNDKEKKARIKEHSDKTKDMPSNGVIAFCTFYKDAWHPDVKPGKDDPSDLFYKNGSVLTRLRFRLKKPEEHKELTSKFDIILYPNSVFIMPLSTNRLYTHEIIPPSLPIDKIPTRMGYTIRCSNTQAVFKNGEMYTINYKPLVKPTPEDIEELKTLYRDENLTTDTIKYPEIQFSLNDGDYKEPKY